VIGLGQQNDTPPGSINHDLVPTPILQTSPSSWAESDPRTPPLSFDAKTEQQGPLIVGVAVARRPAPEAVRAGQSPEPAPRLVLFSSARLADNVIQEIEQTNLDLLMNAANWLRGKAETENIEPHAHVAMTLAIDRELRSRLILVPSLIAVVLIVALGIIVYVARRE
jgi:hypothetical protein